MRRFYFASIAIVLLSCVSCKEKIDIDKEKKAIIAAIEGWTEAEYTADFDLQSTYIAKDDQVVQLGVGKNWIFYGRGLDQYNEFWEWGKKNNMPPNTNRVEHTDYQIRVFPECAWAVYTEKWYNSEGEYLYDVLSTRILEKINEEWKLMYIGYTQISEWSPEQINPSVEELLEQYQDILE